MKLVFAFTSDLLGLTRVERSLYFVSLGLILLANEVDYYFGLGQVDE